MKRFIIFSLMMIICLSINAQQKYEDGIYQIRQAPTKYTRAEYEKIKDFALKNGDTFHFEYEPMMYSKGRRNQIIGCYIIGVSNVAYTLINGAIWINSEDVEQAYRSTLISSCIVGVLDIIGITYISIGTSQKYKSRIAVFPNGIKFIF